MNLLPLGPEEVVDGHATLCGRRARHLLEVLGAEVGSELRAGVVGGKSGAARVTGVGNDRVEISVQLEGPVARTPAVDLILAVPRPKVLERL